MAAIKDRLAKLEAQSRPFAVNDWFRRAIEERIEEENFVWTLYHLCEGEVLLKPSAPIWAKYEAAYQKDKELEFEASAQFEGMSNDEVLEMAGDEIEAEYRAVWAFLLYDGFYQVPAELRAPNALTVLAEYLRANLVKVREDADEWSDWQIGEALAAGVKKLNELNPLDDNGENDAKAALAAIREYQP